MSKENTKRALQLNVNANEYKQFKLYQQQADVKAAELGRLSTRRETSEALKDKFLEVPIQHYMDDPTNLYDIRLYDRRVMVIGDLHAPFILEGYLEFCIDLYNRSECDTVVFIGDVVDNHYSSYHETSPNGYGGIDELERAIDELKPWHDAFPNAYVMIGNHDRLIMRKATTSNIPRQWVRDYKSVLNTPSWIFIESMEIDDVVYVHGEGGTAKNKAKNDLQSHVQGHLHSQAYIEFLVGNKRKVFGMQVGCGVDDSSYAMAYGKNFKKSIISAGVITYGNPYIELMNLEKYK